MPDEITNNKLAKYIGIENLLTIVCTAFALGIAYQVLASDIELTKTKMKGMENEQKQLIKDVRLIQTDVAVIKNDNQHVKIQLREQKEDLKRVLAILENYH